MKNLYIYNLNDSLISNIDKVHISQTDEIPNGSCSNIVCDCLDTVSINTRLSLTSSLLKKLTINGKLILRFVSIKILSKQILADSIGIEELNQIFENCNSVWDENFFKEYISNFPNMQIAEIFYDGLVNQITIQRIF